MASSWVGTSTSASTFLPALAARRSITGIRNARVFPVPVCAVATTSLPCRAGGIASAWTGVGVRKFAAASLCCNPADRENSENVLMRIVSALSLPEGHRARYRKLRFAQFQRTPLEKLVGGLPDGGHRRRDSSLERQTHRRRTVLLARGRGGSPGWSRASQT